MPMFMVMSPRVTTWFIYVIVIAFRQQWRSGEQRNNLSFWYTDNICLWDKFTVGFGLFTGFVNKRNIEEYHPLGVCKD